MGRTFLVTLLTIAAGIGACWPAVLEFAKYWDGSLLSSSHGYVIAAISAWLIWRSRRDVEAAGTEPSWLFAIATALLSFVWYLTWISGLEIGYQLLFLPILLAAIVGAVGLRAARAVGFGVGYLSFAVPFWSYASVPLQSLSTLGVTALARITGVPVYIEVNTVHIPAGSFTIETGCGGINYVVVALAIAALYGELDRCRLRDRVLLLAVAVGLAIVINWLRIYFVILDGHLTNMTGSLVADHANFGRLMFVILLVTFFWIARKIVPLEPGPAVNSLPAVAGAPGRAAVFFAVLAALAVGPALTLVAEQRTDAGANITLALPSGSHGWLGPEPPASPWTPAYPTADAAASGDYERDGARVSVYANTYAYQIQGHELVWAGNNLLGGSGWRAGRSRRSMAHPQDGSIPYIELDVTETGQQRWVLGYFYSVGDRNLTGSISSKLYYGISVLQGRPRTGVVAVASRCTVDCGAASSAVKGFLAANGRALASMIQRRSGAT